jgi:hypothetical protein
MNDRRCCYCPSWEGRRRRACPNLAAGLRWAATSPSRRNIRSEPNTDIYFCAEGALYLSGGRHAAQIFNQLGSRQSSDNGPSDHAPVLCIVLYRLRVMISQVVIAGLMIAGCLAVYVCVIPPLSKPRGSAMRKP